jgi:glutathione S-transferase
VQHSPPPRCRAKLEQLGARRSFAIVCDLWQRALEKQGGPFLFGQRSIADAMFAPVCTRLRTYKVTMPAFAQSYCDAIFADAAFQRMGSGAAKLNLGPFEQSEALYR